METTDPFATSYDELFVPLQQALEVCDESSADFQGFGELCRQTADVLGDVGEDEAALLMQTLGLLGEVVDSSPQTDAAGDEARSEVLEFLNVGLKALRECLAGDADDAPSQLTDLTQQADERWGGPLQLLRDGAIFGQDHSFDQLVDAEDPEWNQDAEPSGQVDLILSALSGTGEVAAESSSVAVATTTREEPPTSAPASRPSTSALDAELLEAYLEDANLCLGSMERAVLEFENDPTSADPVQQLLRELHTLKGASASVGFQELTAQLHHVEEQLEQQLADSSDVPVDLVMNCVDAVRTQISALQPGASRAAATSSSQTSSASANVTPVLADDGPETAASLRVRTAQLDRLMDLLADVVIWRSRREERLTELDTAGDELSRCVFRLQAIDDRLRDRGRRSHSTADDAASLQTSYVAELSNDMREITQQLSQTRQQVAAENRAVSQFIQEFRQELVQIRRVPLAGLFQRLHRSIREAARIEGKEVKLEVLGEQTGLERSLQEKLYEPLLHLVRNAVSHGIESSEDRVKAGKPSAGTVTLDAYGSPHVLMIEVRDDGRGLDFDAIRRRGLERGLLLADRPVSQGELARLIFRPGFSTREVTNEVSGRGVGMNVVEEALDRCRCHIETESEPGSGTCFRLTIPLRSVIEHTLVFRCGGQSFALPMQFVKSASQDRDDVQPTTSDVTHRLADLLSIPSGETPRRQHWIEIADRLASRMTATAAQRLTDEHRICLGVDEILGPEEVVVRPLPPLLRRHPHLCGMTLSGAGEVVLLLDGRRLLMDAPVEDSCNRSAHKANFALASPADQSQAQVLVVDDSLSARRRLVQQLRGCGFRITEAADGLEAIDLLRNGSFDAVFSDLEMPRLGGFDLLGEMSSLSDPPPCVIVTTRTETETQERANALGAAGFLAKPVETAAVREMLCRLQLTRVPQTGDV